MHKGTAVNRSNVMPTTNIVRRCFTPTTILVVLMLLGGFDGSTAERWSRQVSNSEWIPLTNPRAASGHVSQGNAGLLPSGAHLPNPIQSLSLPPVLQQQYQDQLIQLQKTQESIQKLLLLQQQLKAQQQVLQSQTFLPSGFSSTEDEKQGLLPSSLGNLQTTSELLVPPQPSSQALPPIYPSQSFLPHRPGQVPSHYDQNLEANRELSALPVQGQIVLQHGENVNAEDPREGPHSYGTKQGGQRPGAKRPKIQSNPELSQLPLIEGGGDEEEEVQLVYVPAETLAQRGQQPKRGRGRKPYHLHHHHQQQQQQRENQDGVEQAPLSADQEAFARQVLQQIQQEHEEKAQFLKEERVKEFARLNEEQKVLERKTRLQQEALQREQELLRQKEAEKKRKELEKLEEMARQRELERIREAREKQRQEELERRRLAELRAKEEKRREEEAKQREEQEQARRQQLADGTRPKRIRGRQRQRVNQYQEQPNYPESTTTPSPNQPPLSVYMGSSTSNLETIKVTDVLRILRDAKTIAVLDNVGPNTPRVFVGPSNLDPPYGYAKFDLPYLSSIDHNRVERKVDKLPFFVAPLSFDPPAGYSKIPFPAPHIGSVVVNTLSETSPEPLPIEPNPSPTPLIEPNSYSDADQIAGSVATTASYESPTTQSYSPESSGPKYESSYSTPASGSRFRFRQYYDNKPTSVAGSSYYSEQSTTKTKPRTKQYYEEESKPTTQSPKIDTTASFRQEVFYSNAPNFQDRTVGSHDPATKEQDLAAQLALINQELAEQREPQKYNTAEQYRPQANLAEAYDVNDVRAPVGSAQYNLPVELPPISPHLPGLVNSLLDKQEGNLPVTSTPPPTTTTTPLTTTTTRVSSTTYRSRGRSRIVPTRARTTPASTNRTSTHTDRPRRPYNRSKSRFSTTTEDYHESSYEPMKAKIPETTQKYKTAEHKRPTSRTHKYRSRDRTSSQSTIHERNPNVQTHQAAAYENYPTQSDTQSDSQVNVSPDAYSLTNGPTSNLQHKEISSHGTVSDFTHETYLSTTPTQTENYPPLRQVTAQHSAALVSDDYSRSQNYPQPRPQEAPFHGGFEQLEKTPVNGFNYQVGNEESPDQAIPQRPKEYPRYQVKLEDANYNPANTEDPQIRPGEEQQYSPVYEVNVAQPQPQDYNPDGQNLIRDQILQSEDGKIESTAVKADPNVPPIFVPLQHNKQEDYELRIPSTQTPLIEITTTSTTTPAPVIIRQRVRTRLGSRGHHDSAIQTRPRGSQDEYVRFSAVNHDSSRGTGHKLREGSRTRTRVRPQSHGSQVQTEGNEYIKIQAAQQQRLVATTTPTTTTTVATTSVHPLEEDIDYGFIRPPSFQPVNPIPVHPADNRFQAPITYRPPLSEIQHIISNDEAAVESSPAHVLKNRPKYQQTPSRRPATKTFVTTTTSTTTEAVPVATTIPDDTVYTTKPKARPEELRTTRVRGRVRRPGKKRITTTTESVIEANNELPLDENYPRIPSQQLVTVTETGQQTLYEDDFDPSQYVPNRPVQLYEETTGENYPPQEFVLNFDNLPEQVSQREKYDQTQLAGGSSKKYSHSSLVNPTEDESVHPTGDIYGAESQWSTKLSKTSFQPSFVSNHAANGAKRGRGKTRDDRNDENAPEIITAGPDVSFVTMVVSSDYQKHADSADDVDAMVDADVFGRKMNVQERRENAATAETNPRITTLRNVIRNEEDASSEMRNWVRGKERNIVKQTDDDAEAKKVTDPLPAKKGGARRRRVRVRVRPAMDDFVTAESQHFNSAMNSLVQDRYKYNPIRESKFTTAQPIATTITTTTAAPTTQKSLLQDFLEEMLKNDKDSNPTYTTSVTTEFPVWTMSTPMTTIYTSNNDETTTIKENPTPIITTLTPNADNDRATTTSENSDESKNEADQATSFSPEQIYQLSQEEMNDSAEEKSSTEYRVKISQEDKIERNSLENVGIIVQRYKLPSNYPGLETLKETEDSTTGLPTARDKGKEHVMTLKRPEENVEENEAHPKNHRAKWSEVRYPSAFDKSQSALKQHSTTSIPGFTTRNDGESSVKTLSDYVAAIFDSMKSGDSRGEEEEQVAKVVEAKNETPAENSYRFNDIASVREINSKEIEKSTPNTVTTTEFLRDARTTQRVDPEENTTSLPEAQSTTDTTTKESVTTLDSTTPILDSTVNTITPSEETTTTKTATSTEKTITSLGRVVNNVDRENSTMAMLGKVLRTSTTTRVSHMTEICYRGRCVMTKPKMEDATR
ncbi:PREDICTED: uncharacterized protein LOC106750537 [Dinoponera quadriceps]|uniref:Uncharacterized protein LOC106750537 n=1 Tax=Dinoponera quadriceps TaxID=609295 RepID=A0A6P3Y6C3_DINQU|nr:PREDICTED: uncharacterized protein LOC106750537 [Dinoponera quadriceps]